MTVRSTSARFTWDLFIAKIEYFFESIVNKLIEI